MNRILSLLVRLALCFLFCFFGGGAAPAFADTVFSDDFQSGHIENWKGNPGKGDVQLTRYKGNVSLRLTHNAYAVRVVPVAGYDSLMISADFAAENLKPHEECVLETSFDAKKWQRLGQLRDGQDDGLSLHRIGANVSNEGSHKNLVIRLRISAHRDSAKCWADNIRVNGRVHGLAFMQTLSKERFVGGGNFTRPFSTKAFEKPATVPAFQGRIYAQISMGKPHTAGTFSVLKDDFQYMQSSKHLAELPAFSIGLKNDGGMLIPTSRGPIASPHPDWEWIFEPGLIWKNPNDSGWMRAVLPIALQERNANCIHNGLLAFLLKPDGQVSNAVVQIGSETCAYFQFNLRARMTVQLQIKPYNMYENIVLQHRKDQSLRLPRRSLQQLGSRVDLTEIGSALEVSPQNMSVYGYVANGVLYSSACNTRYGPYPFCDALVIPSYSMAKSMAAGIGLMRLENLYPGARSALISDYVAQCHDKRWQEVTFENALDMATGNFTSATANKDEDAPQTWEFMSKTTHVGKIKMACTAHKRKATPGTHWVYHTTDTYILGVAMQAYLRENSQNPNIDIYEDVLAPIWKALNLSPLMQHTRRTYDENAQAFMGWGLSLNTDDLAKVAIFLQNGGRVDGTEWLDRDLLASALQRNPTDRGLKAGDESLRYRAGFWAYNAGPYLGCVTDMWIPSMSGFGGLSLALFPNGHSYFYISDGHEYAWRRAAKQSNQLKPFCEVKP